MVRKPTVYLETTFPSYLAARPSRDVVVAGKQEVTRQWWQRRKSRYQIFVSQYVLDEAQAGDPENAAKRMEAVREFDLLEVDEEVLLLARAIVSMGIIPPKAATDAGHIAVAARHGVDFLLTWNCAHIANAEILAKLNYIVAEEGYVLPTGRCPVRS